MHFAAVFRVLRRSTNFFRKRLLRPREVRAVQVQALGEGSPRRARDDYADK